MKWFLYAFGILWVASGSAYILYTRQFRAAISPLLKKIDRRVLAVIPFIFGILLILSAPGSSNAWFVRALGILAICKSVFIAASPEDHYKQLMIWYDEKASDQTFRLFGIIAIVIGTAVLSWIQ
jgi:uncharacterized protein YjeT (DUF2065 family)